MHHPPGIGGDQKNEIPSAKPCPVHLLRAPAVTAPIGAPNEGNNKGTNEESTMVAAKESGCSKEGATILSILVKIDGQLETSGPQSDSQN